MNSLKRKIAPLLAGFALLILVAGCGIDTDEAPESAGASGSDATFTEPTEGKTAEPVTRATPRSEGNIRIAGKAQGSLSERLVATYELQGGTASVTTTGGNEQTAFDAFCAGQIDIVDSARPISPGEYRQCIA